MFRTKPGTTASSSTSAASSSAATVIQGSIRPPGAPPPDYTRQQHLDSYLQDDTLSKSTRRVSTDDSTYDTVFQTVDQWTLILRVHLPPPSSAASIYVRPPAMTLAGIKARHNWLDSRMQVVGYAPISSDAHWKDARLLLGTAVLQVIQHLQVHPPEVLEIVDKSLQSIQRRTTTTAQPPSTTLLLSSSRRTATGPLRTSTTTTAPPLLDNHHNNVGDDDDYDAAPAYDSVFAGSKPPPPPPSVSVPPVPARLDPPPDASAIQEYLDDDVAFRKYCNSLEYTQTLVALLESALQRNRSTATTQRLQHEPLLTLHRETAASEETLQARAIELERLQHEQAKRSQPPPIRDVQRALQRSKRKAFDESEALAEEWDGTTDVAAFVRQFVAQRHIHHVRAAKLELLLVQQEDSSSNNNGTRGTRPHPQAY